MIKGPNELQIATSCGRTSGQGYGRLVPLDTCRKYSYQEGRSIKRNANAPSFASHKLLLRFRQWLTEPAQRHEWRRTARTRQSSTGCVLAKAAGGNITAANYLLGIVSEVRLWGQGSSKPKRKGDRFLSVKVTLKDWNWITSSKATGSCRQQIARDVEVAGLLCRHTPVLFLSRYRHAHSLTRSCKALVILAVGESR